jgi:hypothetical protein
MHLRIIGDSFSDRIIQEISELTNKSRLQVHSVRHNVEQGTAEFLTDRFPVMCVKSASRFRRAQFTRDLETRIRSQVVIRNVVSCTIEDRCYDCDFDEVTMMFGLSIRGSKVVFASFEEYEGLHLFEFSAVVSELDIEISDL